MTLISEAFNKCFVADFIFSISRTAEDKIANTARMHIAKNRNGEDGAVYPMFMDTSKIELKVFPSQGDTPGSIAAVTAKEQREKIKENYNSDRSQERAEKKRKQEEAEK